ncbi:MAG: hypothetical protein J6S19_03230 [Lentisphaeria bacterium]|nr:hypothetical protein [Lentisphaeria bacterium]
MKSIVCDVAGYNSWPMICAVKPSRLVCLYSRGSEHTIDEKIRGIYARYSDNGGALWSSEIPVSNQPDAGEVPVGKGVLPDGSGLFFVRNCYGSLGSLTHTLYRTVNGVEFQKISTLELEVSPIQITDIIVLPSGVIMALWFAGDYRNGTNHSWGTLKSSDNGLHWIQRVVEKSLPKDQWPTEASGVCLNNGRILVIARREYDRENPDVQLAQFQLESDDCGETWRKSATNITDVSESTPSLLLTPGGRICNYYYERFAGLLKRRIVCAETIWGNPGAWSDPEIVTEGSKDGCNAGNVNALALNGRHYMAYYSGNERNTAVLTFSTGIPD